MAKTPAEYISSDIPVPREYKKGFVDFLGCKIDLSKKPFIPRIETEYWVKRAIKEIKNSKLKVKNLEILDIFAGSGCIGIAILKNIKNSFVDFVDNNKKAIFQIKINLKINKISSKKYKIYRSNLFEKLKGEGYDFIFANPPYVAEERLKEVQNSVLKYEPKTTFLAGKKGLHYIKKFLKEAKKFLKKRGIAYLEFDPLQKTEVKNILEKEGYKDFRFFKDQFKKYRWVRIIQN
ncbi:MAG: HemK family protein methyltransferase [Candidatus Nealsonbacteria bacterium]